MNDTKSVRPIVMDEAPRFAHLMTRYRGAMDPRSRSEVTVQAAERFIHMALEAPHILLYGAEQQNKLAGFALCFELPEIISGRDAGQLDDLFVAPEARGTGLAEALINRFVRIGASRAWVHLRWLVPKDNLRAKRLYDRLAQRAPWDGYRIDL